MRTPIVGGLAGCFAAGAMVTAGQANILDDELAYLLATNPDIQATKAQLSAAEQAVEQAVSGYFPTVAFNTTYGYEYVDSTTRRAINDEAAGGPPFSADLSFTENLFDGFLTKATHQTAAVAQQIAAITVQEITQRVLLDGVTAYLDVIRRRELVSLAKGNESTIQQQLELEDERVERGAGIVLDVLLSKSRLQSSKERRVAFEGTLENSISRYTQVFDKLPPMNALTAPALPIGALPTTLTDSLEIALAEAPRVRAANRQVDLADVTKDTARAGYYPVIDLVAQAGFEHDVSGVTGDRRNYSLLVQASWELLNGFSTRALVAEASFQHKASLDTLMSENRAVVEELKRSWQNLITARDRLALLENAVNIAAEVHVSFRTSREAGQATIFEVLDALNEVFNARINRANAAFDARIAVYRLLRALGRLDADNLALNAALPAQSLSELSERLQFLDDTMPDSIAFERAATMAVKRQEAQLAALSEEPTLQSGADRAESLAPAIGELTDIGEPPTAPASRPAGVREADRMAAVQSPLAPVVAIEPAPMVLPAADRTNPTEETVFIASDGVILDDPNFQRVWSYDY
ncbi:MAG: TolC family outer membrane protein [Alphaproteobacteria bacterium]|jgi:adhesin transport system outer membrane protein|nr:TolC family outer membrane protein [Alphaproteobacteria bacterium]MDP6516393.1 TolC family outer membrane protein [Alphaproteobacteria bacterium]